MDEVSAAEREMRRRVWRSLELMADHQLLGECYWDEGRGARWCIGRPDTFSGRTEIIAGIGGSLVCHGDFDLMRFASYSDYRDAWRRLQWMGRCRDLEYYVAQKASIGTASKIDVWDYDGDVARAELQAELDERLADDSDSRSALVLSDALQEVSLHYKEELQEFLSRRGEEHLEYGRVLSYAITTNWAALQRCYYLLLERYGEGGPDACRR